MTKIRWGMVSAGNIANTFASDIAHVPNAEIGLVAARDITSATEFANKYGIPRACQGYDTLFADPDIDAVYVATPHTLHLKNSADALVAGKSVLCEKPITTSASECQALLDVADKSGAYLMEAMWTWFLPAIRKAKSWLYEGRIGELRHIRADFGYPIAYSPDARPYNAALAGGCLLDMGIYPIAFARLMTESSPRTINVVARSAPNGVDDDLEMLFDYDDFVATLASSFRCRLPNWAYITGTAGYIAIPMFWSATECHLYNRDELLESFKDDRQGSGFEFQIEAVSQDLIDGCKESTIVTHADSLAFQRDMDRVRSEFSWNK